MNVSILVLVGWLSATLAPLSPTSKYPSPELEQAKQVPLDQPMPSPELDKPAAKLPAITKPARVQIKPGKYALESLQLPKVVAMEQFDGWQPGPAWPYVDSGVVVVTDNAADPSRFLAFLVDVNNQRILAIRDGNKANHLLLVGQMQGLDVNGGKDPYNAVPATIMTLAGSGAVIILRPPVPPGPSGIPDDFTSLVLDAATVTGRVAGMVSLGKPGKGGFH
jgi:hypothetical protein